MSADVVFGRGAAIRGGGQMPTCLSPPSKLSYLPRINIAGIYGQTAESCVIEEDTQPDATSFFVIKELYTDGRNTAPLLPDAELFILLLPIQCLGLKCRIIVHGCEQLAQSRYAAAP